MRTRRSESLVMLLEIEFGRIIDSISFNFLILFSLQISIIPWTRYILVKRGLCVVCIQMLRIDIFVRLNDVKNLLRVNIAHRAVDTRIMIQMKTYECRTRKNRSCWIDLNAFIFHKKRKIIIIIFAKRQCNWTWKTRPPTIIYILVSLNDNKIMN